MSLRIINEFHSDNRYPELRTKVYKSSDLQEYQVRMFVDGEYYVERTYFTTDKEDALQTAQRMINH